MQRMQFRFGNTHEVVIVARMLTLVLLLWSVDLRAFQQALPDATRAPPAVWVVALDGAITPAAADFIHRTLHRASDQRVSLVVLRIDTPGGLDSAMRDIIRDILASPVPVATFVAPNGARAASAGTYILYASHVAAMSPASTLGAATPVQIGGAPPAGKPNGQEPDGTKRQRISEDALATKRVNDAAAYIRSLAQLRGRNGEWAERAVREAVSLSANEALRQKVIDVIADDLNDLLRKIDGRVVQAGATPVRLAIAGARIESVEPDWRTRLLSVIADPNVALILMMLGMYGLFFELANPGSGVPGTIGAICLILALFAFQSLPVNYAGLALLVLGFGLIAAEFFLPSFGVFGIGGIAAFIFGGVLLFDATTPIAGGSLTLLVALAVLSACFLFFVVGMAVRARRRPVVTGEEELIGSGGELIEVDNREGYARVHGERWRVTSDVPLAAGQRIRVTAVHGLTLRVTPETQQLAERTTGD
jgi:membrane-bound serine protease (ClpP class)